MNPLVIIPCGSHTDQRDLHKLGDLPPVKTYTVNEVFYSLQGEGVRAGTANVFVRFTGCNLACDVLPGPRSPGGFACDTEFVSGTKFGLNKLYGHIQELSKECKWLVLTGGEPGLQVDKEFCDYFHGLGYSLAIETNGTVELPFVYDDEAENGLGKSYCLDWITLSPKVAEHAVRQPWANELKYVRGYKQGIPKPSAKAEHYLISPSFSGEALDKKVLEWCIQLCLQHPQWRLSCQQHKLWNVR